MQEAPFRLRRELSDDESEDESLLESGALVPVSADVTMSPEDALWELYDLEGADGDEDEYSPPSSRPSKPSRIKFKAFTDSATSNRPGKRRREISNEMTLKRLLLRDYDLTSRPVINDSTTVTVSVGMSLFHILDTVSESLSQQ